MNGRRCATLNRQRLRSASVRTLTSEYSFQRERRGTQERVKIDLQGRQREASNERKENKGLCHYLSG